MDIRKFAVEQTGRIEIRDADGELIPGAVITVYSPGSKQYAKAQANRSNRTVDLLRRKGKADQTPEGIAEEKASYLSDCTASFEGIEYDKLEGKALYKAVYSDVSLGFIADQVAEYLGDWSNFTKDSTKI